jgi:5-methylcytosine-specific restriction endonuclease McrA
MASDVTGKAPGPLWKPGKLSKQGVPILGGGRTKKHKKVYPYWWMGAKVDSKWIACRIAWFDQNPPNHQGYYQCALCPQMVHKSEVTLDHIITRSKDKSLKYELSNLQPAHYLCNTARGSMSMEAWNTRKMK